MRIHVEGCDRTGKTTLINYLKEHLDFEVIKFSQPKTQNPFKEYETFLKETKGQNLILDRSWLGENVYGPIYRKKGLKEEQFTILDDMCELNEDIFIITNLDKETVAQNFIKDGEDFTKTEHIQLIMDRFLEEGSKLNTTKILYNYKLQNLDSILDIILVWMRDRIVN